MIDPEGALYEVQRLQFSDLPAANARLTELFQPVLPFALERAEIVPRAVSLNSISGLLISEAGEKFFFKTHVEPDSVLQEYYNGELLQNAGYPIVSPMFASQVPGRQIVVYPFITMQTVFDLAHAADVAGEGELDGVLAAQVESDGELLEIYRETLRPAATDDVVSPVHQLFYNRLRGARFAEFPARAVFRLGGREMPFAEIAGYRWVVNGVEYGQTLAERLDWAAELLRPEGAWGPTVVGHGDAHAGNLFYDEPAGGLVYFDPAFAGRHSPLLDMVKPLFHNVFATWMYYPAMVAEALSLEAVVRDGTIEMTHDYRPSAFRRGVLESKVKNVLEPLLGMLRPEDRVRGMEQIRAALLCCPLLTVNLGNREKYPDAVALLGLSQCVEAVSPAVERGAGLFGFLDGFGA